MKRIKLAVIAAAGAFTVSGAPQAAAQVRVGTGVEYTTGKYGGTQSTDMLYVPFTAKYESGLWTFKATVPYIVISGSANVVGAGAERITLPDGDDDERRTEAGLGDVVASAFYTLLDERTASIGMDLGAKVKLATADEAKGLGTGETDYSLQADFFKPLGAATAFGSLGYRWYGDPPGINLRDVPYGAIGASYRVSAQTSVGVAYDYRARITQAGSPISEASAFWSLRMSPQWRLQVYGIIGFSDASPDAGVGTVLEHRY